MKKVIITDAGNMSDETYGYVCERFSGAFEGEEDIQFERRHNPELLGGFTVTAGDRIYDASLRCRLTQMREHIQKGE